MKNDYEIRGEVTAIFIKSPKYGKLEALISTAKLDVVKLFPNTWCAAFNKNRRMFYVRGRIPNIRNKNVSLLLHRLVTKAPEGFEVDHINHDTLDNTDSNLRVVTVSENQQNRKGATKKSISGVRGVNWNKHAKKWTARIKIDSKPTTIGYFDTIEEAESAVITERSKRMPFSNEASA